jgi:hypothetical protein
MKKIKIAHLRIYKLKINFEASPRLKIQKNRLEFFGSGIFFSLFEVLELPESGSSAKALFCSSTATCFKFSNYS